MRRFIKAFSKIIAKSNEYNEEQEQEVEYALRVIIFEVAKFIGTIIVFCTIGYPVQGLLAIGLMSLSKPFIGGYHEDNQVKCFISTLVTIGSIIYLENNIRLNFTSVVLLGGVSIFCIWNQAPIVNPKMMLTKIELINRNRRVGIFIIVLQYLVSIILFKYTCISTLIVWVILFQALLMFNKKKDINLGES
ncbi:accessory gene regulator B family protein [Clostridium sp. 'White wine YQ']|uniref:accessory gene regulator B family protein n=1 Tax=Clostridium sp. 'White wine YQ' TaxID=3027474 RepID=UPI0023673196|nr:accessory gene regulator B family protein [Clostridium sp. 'White wine YQ']MDD7795962.1 accessory gene regulator B family protein [Clostridium sp. 'White wine YQ']